MPVRPLPRAFGPLVEGSPAALSQGVNDNIRALCNMPDLPDALIQAILDTHDRDLVFQAVACRNRAPVEEMLVQSAADLATTKLDGVAPPPSRIRQLLFGNGRSAFLEELLGEAPDHGPYQLAALLGVPRHRAPLPGESGVGDGSAHVPATSAEATGASVVVAQPRSPSRTSRPAPAGAVSGSNRSSSRGLAVVPTPKSAPSPSAGAATESDTPAVDARAAGASIHVYNKTKSATGSLVSRAALCVVATVDRQGVPSILFEAAGPHPVTPDRFNWSDKVTFMVDQDEIQQVLCVLLGYLEEASLRNHGPARNKYLTVKRQESSMYLTMGEGKERSVAVNIAPGPATRIALLMLGQFKAASAGLGEAALHMALSRIAAPMFQAQSNGRSAKPAR
jgi:hypothetical protein